MSENQIESNGNQRTSASERLSTGTLARWARMCANQSGRATLVGALTFIALLVATVLFRGSLRDQFEIPGSETQKATDLIESPVCLRTGWRLEPRLRGAAEVSSSTPPSARRPSRTLSPS